MQLMVATMVSVLLAVAATPAEAAQSRRDRSAGPKGNPGEWFSAENYPTEARKAGVEGRVVTRLSIDATGAVTNCTVTTTSGSPLLDEGTCEVARREGRFEAARDRRGRAVASTYTLPVRWSLEAQDLIDTASTVEADVSSDGNAISCRRDTPSDQADRRCPPEVAGLVASLPLDASGYTLVVRTSVHVGESPTADQLPPAGADIQFLRVAKVFVNEFGKIIECVPIDRKGFDAIPGCPATETEIGIRRGPDDVPGTAWAVMAMYAVKRSPRKTAP